MKQHSPNTAVFYEIIHQVISLLSSQLRNHGRRLILVKSSTKEIRSPQRHRQQVTPFICTVHALIRTLIPTLVRVGVCVCLWSCVYVLSSLRRIELIGSLRNYRSFQWSRPNRTGK